MRNWQRWAPGGMLAAGCLLLLSVNRQHTMPLARPLGEIPRTMVGRAAHDRNISEKEQAVAGMDDYLLRWYAVPGDSIADFSTYVGYYERQSQALLGYALPQIWLLHANELNAVAYAELIAGAKRRGYRFISLDEAMQDPAYTRKDGYHGRYGPSWLHRWAMAEKKPKTFYAGEPVVPKWVLDLAGVDGE